MNIKNILKNEFVFTILQIIFTVIGFLMIFMEIKNGLDFGDNVWNARLYKFTAIASIGLGVAFTGKSFIRKLKRFCFIFGILFLSLIFLGGGFMVQDMLEGNFFPDNLWIIFDCSLMMETSPEIQIIEFIVPIIISIIIIVYGIVMFFRTETMTEKIQMVVQVSLPIFLYIVWNLV